MQSPGPAYPPFSAPLPPSQEADLIGTPNRCSGAP